MLKRIIHQIETFSRLFIQFNGSKSSPSKLTEQTLGNGSRLFFPYRQSLNWRLV